MAVGLSALRVELLTDPASIGYVSHVNAGRYSILLQLLGSVSANANTAGSAVTVGTIQSISLQQCVVVGEYAVLTDAQRDLWNAIITTAVTGIAISNTVIRQQIAGIWSAGTTTRSNLAALQTRPCSRLETLFGEGSTLDINEVIKAVNGDF